MINENLTFDDLNGLLILLCYDTVSTEDEDDGWSYCLPYTFENGNLIRYELDGEDDIDQNIDLSRYGVAQTTPFDVESFPSGSEVLQ